MQIGWFFGRIKKKRGKLMKSPNEMEQLLKMMNSLSAKAKKINSIDDYDELDFFGQLDNNSPNNYKNKNVERNVFLKTAHDLLLRRDLTDNQRVELLRSHLLEQPSSSGIHVFDFLTTVCRNKNHDILKAVFFDRDVLNRFFDINIPQECVSFAASSGDLDLINFLLEKETKEKMEVFSKIHPEKCIFLAAEKNHAPVLLALLDNAPQFNPYIDLDDLFKVCFSKKALSSLSVICERFKGTAPLPAAVSPEVFLSLLNTTQNEAGVRLVDDFLQFDRHRTICFAHKFAEHGQWDAAVRVISCADKEDYQVFVKAWRDKKQPIKNESVLVKSFWEKADLERATDQVKNDKNGPPQTFARKM